MKVEVLFSKNKDRCLFRITTPDTILTLTESDTKKLYRELSKAFRPTKHAPDVGRRAAKSGASKRKKSTIKSTDSQPPQVM